MSFERDGTVDTLRGIAIVTMVPANMAPSALAAPHPLGERLFGTFAAPLFVFLSGMMVAYAVRRGARLRHVLARGGVLLVIASAIELVGGSFPLVSCDVLYLIAVALPLAYASLRVPPLARALLALLVFAVAPVLQAWHYHPEIARVELREGWHAYVSQLTTIGDNWLVNGYFPVFPWLGFALLGAAVGSWRWQERDAPQSFAARRPAGVALACLAIGIVWWWAAPGPHYVRNGYSEMFYPATPGYVLTSLGVIGLLFTLVDWRPRVAGYRVLQTFGQASLFMYIGHLAIIYFALEALVSPGPVATFIALVLAVLAVLLVACVLLARARPRTKRWPLPLRMLVGA